MNKLFALVVLSIFTLAAKAQTPAPPIKEAQPYGQIDTADLKLKSCDFEKDANAMVLFDKGDITFGDYGVITYLHHERIKIFNDNGKGEANITIPFIDDITDITAQTINLNGNTIEFTPVDSKLIYKEKIDKYRKVLVFTFPDVRPGSVIELQYKWKSDNYAPDWHFQTDIPTRYSEVSVTMVNGYKVNTLFKVRQPYSKNVDEAAGNKYSPWGQKFIRGLSNVPPTREEPYASLLNENTQRLIFKPFKASWTDLIAKLLIHQNFSMQLIDKLTDEDSVLKKVTAIKSDDAKIDSIFNIVKGRMQWNKVNSWDADDGTRRAWNKKTGNSAEINLILYHLLRQAGINAYPMMVSTRTNGVVDTNFANLTQFNKLVVYIPVGTEKYYILDASNQYNTYNRVPFELLSTWGFAIDPKLYKYCLVPIQSYAIAKQLVFINATVGTDAKVSGTAEIISDSYNKTVSLKLYDDLGKEKYIDDFSNNNNDLKISALEMENTRPDTLPLTQHINFTLNLSASDANYIYINPNIFTGFRNNPFLSETRYNDIDFNYTTTYVISSIYRIPAGYKTYALPKNQSITMPDGGINFKRLVEEQNGAVMVRYIIDFKKTTYTKDEYPALFAFYKKMYEMLNEQIVLKKS